jgi:Carboxypeptidase regulatory-like domain
LELPFVEIKLASRPARRIRGRILDAHGDPAARVEISLGNGFGPRYHEVADENGDFEFGGVTAGEWRLTATKGSEGEELWAAQTIRISDRDVENLVIRLAKPFALQGKIVLQAPQGISTEGAAWPNVIAQYDSGDFSQEGPPGIPIGQPDHEGDFTINAYPGTYRFAMLEDAPAGFYVDSIRLGRSDALAPGGVPIESGAAQLTIVYKVGGGTVRGTVESCANGRVTIVPADSTLRLPQFIRQVKCETGGQFEISGVRPGDYYGVALAGDAAMDGWALVNEEDLLAKQGSRITVREGETVSVEVRVVRF